MQQSSVCANEFEVAVTTCPTAAARRSHTPYGRVNRVGGWISSEFDVMDAAVLSMLQGLRISDGLPDGGAAVDAPGILVETFVLLFLRSGWRHSWWRQRGDVITGTGHCATAARVRERVQDRGHSIARQRRSAVSATVISESAETDWAACRRRGFRCSRRSAWQTWRSTNVSVILAEIAGGIRAVVPANHRCEAHQETLGVGTRLADCIEESGTSKPAVEEALPAHETP